MLDESRMNIYDFVYGLFQGVVTDNVYSVTEPQELTESDVQDGFIVISVGDITDASEFDGRAYGRARVTIVAYVPPMSRGRMDHDKYREFEDGINTVIRGAIEAGDMDGYTVLSEGLISADADETSNANNQFFMFIKSFRLLIDKD